MGDSYKGKIFENKSQIYICPLLYGTCNFLAKFMATTGESEQKPMFCKILS